MDSRDLDRLKIRAAQWTALVIVALYDPIICASLLVVVSYLNGRTPPLSEAETSKLLYRVSCECGDEHTGEADSYPEAWGAMDRWKQPHNWMKHPSRSKPFDSYSWNETVKVVGDRTPYDGLPPGDPNFKSALFPELSEARK